MNEDKSETTGQRTDDPMLDHACTMRIALAIARRQNELDLRLHRIEQALKLGGHANFPSTDRNQPTTQKNKERTDNGRNTADHDRIHVRARREEHHRGPFQSQRDHLLAQDQHRRKLDPHPIHDPEHPVRPDPARRGHEDHPVAQRRIGRHEHEVQPRKPRLGRRVPAHRTRMPRQQRGRRARPGSCSSCSRPRTWRTR